MKFQELDDLKCMTEHLQWSNFVFISASNTHENRALF